MIDFDRKFFFSHDYYKYTTKLELLESKSRNVSRYFAALRRLTGYRISSCNAAVFCEGNEARICTAIFVYNGGKNVAVQREREKSRCIYTHIYLHYVQYVSVLFEPVQKLISTIYEKNKINA